MKRTKLNRDVIAAMRAKGFTSDRQVADEAGLIRSQVTKARLAIGKTSLTVGLTLERVLHPYLRAEQLAMSARDKAELAALRARQVAPESAA